MLGGDFAAILKLGDHFAGNGQFRSPFRGFQMALVCQKVVSQSQNTLRNGALAVKLGVFMLRDFAAVSQLRNESHCAAKWHSCAKKWLHSCEILCEMELSLRKWDLSCFGGSQPFRSCEMGAPVLRSGTRVPKVVSQLRKFSQKGV